MKPISFFAAALGLCLCTAVSAQTAPTLRDVDGDGIPDVLDNCVQVSNPDQRDSNGNGIGDLCDGDVNGDGIVNAIDLALLRQQFGQPRGSADLNGDGSVNALDLALLRSRFGQRPGPIGEVLQQMQMIDPQLPPEGPESEPESPRPEAQAPALLLPQVLDAIDEALRQSSGPVAAALLQARPEIAAALAHLSDGSTSGGLVYLTQAVGALRSGYTGLEAALNLLAPTGDPRRSLLLPAVQKVREAAARSSAGLMAALVAGGVSEAAQQPAQDSHQRGLLLLAAGSNDAALGAFEMAVTAATPLLAFNIDLFVSRLRSVFDGQSVGWAYAVGRAGVLQRSGAMGLARTAANVPATLQTENKRMHVASISKTLTTIITLRLLAERGLTADATIGPFLPSNWVRGAGANTLRFRDLMTHRSGFKQNAVAGNDYASLRDVIAKPVGDVSYQYSNANFGMLRVLVSRLVGVDPASFIFFNPAQLSSGIFMWRAQQIYGAIGVPFHCSSEVIAQTRQYKFPADGLTGYAEPDRRLQCGGYGVNISAVNLTRVLSFWRYTNDLLPNNLRTAMRQQYLGLMDPANFGFAQGDFGVYQGHGGDWDHGEGGLDTCMYSFPNLIEAAVVVNSSRKTSGGYANGGGTHQCSVLKWAYEGAWVAN